MYARPQHMFMRRAFSGSAVMRRFSASAPLAATQATSQTLRPAVTVWARCCHIVTMTHAQGGTKQDDIKGSQFALNGGHKAPHDLIAKFPNERKLGVFTSDGRAVTVHVAAYESDWAHFNDRQCDFLDSDMCTLATTIPEGGRSSVGSSMQSG